MAVLAPEIVSFDGAWYIHNGTRAVYDSATDTLFFGVIRSDGKVNFYSWNFTDRLWMMGTPRTSVLEVDDHDNPSLVVLDNGEILAAYSQHNGDSFSARTANAGDIRTWDAEVAVSSGNFDSYANLFQMGDTAKTVFWFFRRGSAGSRPIHVRSSTDRGDTWSAVTELFTNSNRPYFIGSKTSSSRIDFVLTDGSPADVSSQSIYHGYLLVASDASLTFFKSDGTAVTSAPFNPNEFTQVYDGSTVKSWNWDIQNISGTPTIIYATFESSDAVHRYYQARWNGSAWQSDEITTGGTTATADYFSVAEVYYSGGGALDPNDINTVYVSREYGAANFRLEKWTHTGSFPSGTWTKDADTSGDTSTMNARPYCVRDLSPTRVLWFEGAWTTWTSYATRIRMSPAPSWRAAKASSPVWTPSYAPSAGSGIQAYFLLHNGSGAPSDVTGNGYGGSLVGSPTWNAGAGDDFGAFLSGFTASDYVSLNTLAAALNITNYPIWMATLFKSTSSGTTALVPTAFGNSGNDQPLFWVILNNAVANLVQFQWRDAAGAGGLRAETTAVHRDGEFHLTLAVKESAGTTRLYLDGAQVDSGSGETSGAVTFDRGAIGCRVRGVVTLPFTSGEVHAVVVGWGAVPNTEWLAMDLLRGQFQGTFDPAAAALSGTLLGATEADVVAGGKTIVITVSGDSWIPS